MKNKNYGILASIDWNSNQWKDYPTKEDLANSKFGFVEENKHTFTYLNFAHNERVGLKDGEYEALIPHFWSELPSAKKSEYVKVVFIKSKKYTDGNTYIVGLYAFPRFEKKNKLVKIQGREETIDINLISKKEDILFLDKPVGISDESMLINILPSGKKAGKMSYNYLTSKNVKTILDIVRKVNPDMMELKSINGIKSRLLKSLPTY